MVSVIEVNTAKDLKTAKVYVSCYGGDTEQTFDAIKDAPVIFAKNSVMNLRNLDAFLS